MKHTILAAALLAGMAGAGAAQPVETPAPQQRSIAVRGEGNVRPIQ